MPAAARLDSLTSHLRPAPLLTGAPRAVSAAADAGPVDPRTLKACVFDVFGTVVDWRRSVAREAEAVAQRHGKSIDANAFAVSWRALYGPSMQENRESGNFVKLDTLHRNSLDTVLRQLSWDLPADERDELNLAWHRLDPWPDSAEGLALLKRERIVATLSNGNSTPCPAPATPPTLPTGPFRFRAFRAGHEMRRGVAVGLMVDMARRGGLVWDCILGAEVARHYKASTHASDAQTPPRRNAGNNMSCK